MANPIFSKEEIEWILTEFKIILEGNGPLSMGRNVKEFENIFSKFLSVKYALGTNSCSSALEIALRASGVKKGDEVVVPSQTFIATAYSVLREGAEPIFCDIDASHYCMSIDSLKQKVSKKTKAVILVHMGGMISPDALKIKEYCNYKNIILIEDAAHAIGASIEGIKAGNIGDIGCFSFYPTKIITTSEGGMLVTSNKKFYELARSYRSRGLDFDSHNEVYSRLGTNNRMTEIAALLGISQMRVLKEYLNKRKNIADIYSEKIKTSSISSFIKILNVPKQINHSYWRYTITLDPSINREQVKQILAKDQIQSDWAYYPPVHLQPYFADRNKSFKVECPVVEKVLNHNFCLPLNPSMSIRDCNFVVDKFIKAVEELT